MKYFPRLLDEVDVLPQKKNLWVFVMAGQSNMSGRGLVEPSDTVSHPRILTVTPENQWVYAKEPLHLHESRMTGLDCGLAFGRELLKHVGDSVHIALIPCAVGGSSIGQWLGDSLHRSIYLRTSFESKVKFAQAYGEIKGILWHQGENDARFARTDTYENSLIKLVRFFRSYVGNDTLPVIAGELGLNKLSPENQQQRDSINEILWNRANEDRYVEVVRTRDLTTHDHYHFDSPSLRVLGRRYAEQFIKNAEYLFVTE